MEKGKLLLPILVLVLTLVVSGCGKQPVSESPTGESESAEAFVSEQIDDSTSEEQAASETESVNEPSANENEATQEDTKEDTEAMLQMRIGDTAVTVEWEDNESVQALRDLCTDNPLTIQMSMYGGFEQVGSIGQSLPRDDQQTTTGAETSFYIPGIKSSSFTALTPGPTQDWGILPIRMRQECRSYLEMVM